MDVPLLEKRAGQRALAFTPEGAALGKAAYAALKDLEIAVLTTREGGTARSVTIATTPSFAMRWLLPRLPRLAESYPALEVSILVDQACKSPAATGADLNIRMGAQPAPDLHPIPLMNESVFPVIAPELWESLGRPSTLVDLAKLPLLHDRDPSTSWSTWRTHHGPDRLNVRQGPRLTSSDLILRAAEQGQGVALARGHLAADSLAQGSLIRPFGGAELDLGPNYWIIAHPDTGRRRVVQTVTDWLQQEAHANPQEAVETTSVS